MLGRKSLKWIYYFNLAVVLALVAYKVYLNFFEQDFESVHSEQVAEIQRTLADRDQFRFAVVGNINNSIGIFERTIVPMLNEAEVDLVISAGNAVSNGGEDKYRALNRTLERLQVPYVLTFGEHEFNNFGSFRYYEHYGPYFFSFEAGNSRFIFLDSTSKTPYQWQLHWLEEELNGPPVANTFIFLGHPVYQTHEETLLYDASHYLGNRAFRHGLTRLIREHPVDAVFSANLSIYQQLERDGTTYITTGGAGGLVLNDGESFYHFVTVDVDGDQTEITLQALDIGQHRVLKTLESFWFFIHSLFYVGYHNFILLLCILIAVSIKLRQVIFEERDYYPDFDLDPTPWLNKPLRVAMLTNNYLPFIGGVPLSIERLRQGLKALGHQVLIVAPRYRDKPEGEDPEVIRASTLLTFGNQKEFRLANIFQPRLRKRVTAFRPDIVHVHHPFWFGSLGLWIARRRKVPVVYTYHTRLEHYAHFVPLPGHLFRNLISHFLIKRFANKCDGVIVPTYSAEEYLRVLGVRTDIFVQPTGIDFARFQQTDPGHLARLRQSLSLGEERVLISVSRLSREKNIEFMIDALRGLKARSRVPFRLLIAGDGNDRDRLQARIDRYDLGSVVTLVGSVDPDQLVAYYQLADAFVFASKSETQGMVILEAMAAGLPVVAVRSSGTDDVIQEGVTGFKTRENQEKWQAQVLKLVEDDRIREEMSINAREFARAFSIENFARDVNHVYACVLAAQERGEE